MEYWFPIIFTGVVIVVGTVIAILWWRLAAKAAPYADERERGARSKPEDARGEVVVIDTRPSARDSTQTRPE